METSEILNGAADHLERYGHHKGSGYGGVDASTAPACLMGAINVAAMHNEPMFAGSGQAIKALREHIGTWLVTWNDAPERTQAEVVEALRAAALIESARESQVAAEATYAENLAVAL